MSSDSDHGDLPASQQTRNVLLYAANAALIYLASPVTYVGLVHGALTLLMPTQHGSPPDRSLAAPEPLMATSGRRILPPGL